MKNLFASIVIIAYAATASCQTDSSARKTSVYPRLDTISYYQIDSESMSIEKGIVLYKVNNKSVSEQQWKKMTIGISKIKICTPCIVKTYSANDYLISIGVQYKKCDVGGYTGYYPDGRVRVTGQYKENPTGKWDRPILSTYCSKKEGIWTYYTESGKIKELELYTDGKLIKKTPVN